MLCSFKYFNTSNQFYPLLHFHQQRSDRGPTAFEDNAPAEPVET